MSLPQQGDHSWGEVREGEFFLPGMRAGKSLQESGRLGLGGSDTPTSGFMMSDSARAFPGLRQWAIEIGVGLESLGSREE